MFQFLFFARREGEPVLAPLCHYVRYIKLPVSVDMTEFDKFAHGQGNVMDGCVNELVTVFSTDSAVEGYIDVWIDYPFLTKDDALATAHAKTSPAKKRWIGGPYAKLSIDPAGFIDGEPLPPA